VLHTGTLAVDGRVVSFGTVKRGLGEAAARPGPPRCTKCNSPSMTINGQYIPITVLLCNGPLLCGFNVPIKGLRQASNTI